MLPELKQNDVVIEKNLMVFYLKYEKSKNDPLSYALFSTSKDAYPSLFSRPQSYFKHVVSNSHGGTQFMTDNLELVLRARSTLHLYKNYASFPHYAKKCTRSCAY